MQINFLGPKMWGFLSGGQVGLSHKKVEVAKGGVRNGVFHNCAQINTTQQELSDLN